MASTTPYNVDNNSLEGIRFFFGPSYQYLHASMNTALSSSFSEIQINALYQDGAAKQSMAPTAFKKLKETTVISSSKIALNAKLSLLI